MSPVIEPSGEGFRVSGPLTIETAASVLERAREIWPGAQASGPVRIDLGGVDKVDSAALSVLLSWRRLATRDGLELTFVNLPENLMTLAELYALEHVLSGEGASLAGAHS